MNTLLADPSAASSSPPPLPSAGAPAGATPAQPPAEGPVCAHCGAPLQEAQRWCLNCGACEPGSLGERPTRRPLIVLALTAAILVAAAAVAGAAALSRHTAASHPPAVALVSPTAVPTTPSATTPATPGLPVTKPRTNGAAGTHSTSKGSLNNLLFPPTSAAKPPKIPVPTATPKSTGGLSPTGESTSSGGESNTTSSENTSSENKSSETGTSTTGSKSKEGSGSETPNPILLDTDAASTYNPYNYSEAGFGDPALAIDGEPSTAWTAQVQPASFPKMAEGLLIDLRSPTKLGRLELRTPTVGITVEVYGAGGAKAPATITDPGWTPLAGSHVLKKKVTRLKLHTGGKPFRRLLVWIVKAPASSRGTPKAPGHAGLSEVALYPPTF